MQHYVNHAPDILNQTIQQALNQPLEIVWTSPLKVDLYREFKDRAFLTAVGQSEHFERLKAFWPKNGPRWDATGRVESPSKGVLLPEGKSHLSELYAGECTAKSRESLDLIDASLARTKKWLNADLAVNWRGRFRYQQNGKELAGCLYQSANRLAHLFFFREVLGIDAWLVNICFVDDPYKPTTRAEWEVGLARAKKNMGIPGEIPYCVNVLLPAVI